MRVVGFVRRVGDNQKNVDDGLRDETLYGRRSGMLDPQRPFSKSVTDSVSFAAKQLRPLRIVILDQNCIGQEISFPQRSVRPFYCPAARERTCQRSGAYSRQVAKGRICRRGRTKQRQNAATASQWICRNSCHRVWFTARRHPRSQNRSLFFATEISDFRRDSDSAPRAGSQVDRVKQRGQKPCSAGKSESQAASGK